MKSEEDILSSNLLTRSGYLPSHNLKVSLSLLLNAAKRNTCAIEEMPCFFMRLASVTTPNEWSTFFHTSPIFGWIEVDMYTELQT